MNLKLFRKLCTFTQPQLLEIMTEFLQKNYNKVISTPSYVIAEGDLPVALVAHLDTVGPKPPKDIYYDQEAKIMWSPQLLGADDRAGVYSILKIIQDGYRPHIILTCDEEIGCIGAMTLAQDFKRCPFKNLKALIQLDRRGQNDSVYYDCDNKKFEKFINSYGFETASGTFSDISVLGPAFKVAAVNLSIGYLNEHNPIETLNIDWMAATIEKVESILIDIDSHPRFKYIKSIYAYSDWIGGGPYTVVPILPKSNKECCFCGQHLTKKNRIRTPDGLVICQKCFAECY